MEAGGQKGQNGKEGGVTVGARRRMDNRNAHWGCKREEGQWCWVPEGVLDGLGHLQLGKTLPEGRWIGGVVNTADNEARGNGPFILLLYQVVC